MREITGKTHVIFRNIRGINHDVLLYLVNKQLGDKERVAAALENTHLLKVINRCLNFKQ